MGSAPLPSSEAWTGWLGPEQSVSGVRGSRRRLSPQQQVPGQAAAAQNDCVCSGFSPEGQDHGSGARYPNPQKQVSQLLCASANHQKCIPLTVLEPLNGGLRREGSLAILCLHSTVPVE